MNHRKFSIIIATLIYASFSFLISCSKNYSVNIVYYHLVDKGWQEVAKQDINGNNFSPSYTLYYFYPDFRLAKRCSFVDPFCIGDNNGSWSLTPNNQYLTILTNSGFTTAEIILITETILILKPSNSSYLYTFSPI
ncbi:MAG: hypothetical protein ACQPRJ_04670 [Solitalea-like symbiont of Acarus siro]